ncbi:MAG: HD family phosphohydrolase [Bdellovibrionaceae bacterium]|mgnify:CR=1 FL=1|nr:HD family phosphohydrolase [Pseudobdellovibrionaceae bacterium]|tara:strand:- start:28729 stop:29679 length:951 start_codon:yes stop_codon:yes gene_type:complete
MEATNEYFKIRINSVHPSSPIPFDIFISLNQKMVHYLRAGDSITAEKLYSFKEKAQGQFYIPQDQRQIYKDYIHDRLTSSDLSAMEKAVLLRESSISLVEELYENPDVAKALADSRPVVKNFIDLMDEEPSAMSHLISLSSHDFYTYNHSLDVCIYALGLGQAVGFGSADLKELGEGALFHDIGKRNVNVDIICKAGPLDDVEWAQMQKHPQFGLQILMEQDVTEGVMASCYEHHESWSGGGYPQDLEAEEIHPMARVVALTDTYDALTTKRTYNTPMTPKDAVQFMESKLFGKYDPDMIKAMSTVLFKMQKDLSS